MTTGSTIARFTITLSKSVAEPVQVAWNTKDGTAKAGIDYAAASGTAVFSPGETNKDVDVLVYGRAVGTEDRNFFLEMTPPPNAILGESIGECIIYLDTAGNTAKIQVIVPTGPQGAKGDSAYQSWLNLGNTGTEQDFIDSLSPSPEEIAEAVAPILNVGNSPVTAKDTQILSHPDNTTVSQLARRVAYVGAVKIATVVLADGDNIIAQADLTGDTVDFNSVGLYPRLMRGTSVLSPVWSVENDGRLLIKAAVAGDALYVCQYDFVSSQSVTNLCEPIVLNAVEPVKIISIESLRRSYAEAGYNVVGTFQAGFTIVNANDVGIDLVTGKGYSGPAGNVDAGTNPTAGGSGFVDKSDMSLSQDLQSGAMRLQSGMYALRDVVSIRDFGGVDDHTEGTTNGTNNKSAFAKAIAHLNLQGGGDLLLPRTYTGKYFVNGDDPTQVTSQIRLVPDKGVSVHLIYSGGAANSPLVNTNLQSSNSLRIEFKNFGFSSFVGGQVDTPFADTLPTANNGDGVFSVPRALAGTDFSTVRLSDTNTVIAPVSTSSDSLVYAGAGVPTAAMFETAIGEEVFSLISSPPAGTFFAGVITANGYAYFAQDSGTQDVKLVDGTTGLPAVIYGVPYDHTMDQQRDNFNNALLSVKITSARSFSVLVNGLVIGCYTTRSNIQSACFGTEDVNGDVSLSQFTVVSGKSFGGSKPLRILVSGDSITDDSVQHSWAKYLQMILGTAGVQVAEINNFAVSGTTAAAQLALLQTAGAGSDYCLIQVGVNDIQSGTDFGDFVSTIINMVTYAKGIGAQPIVGIPTSFYSLAEANANGQPGGQNTSNNASIHTYRALLMRAVAAAGGLLNLEPMKAYGAMTAKWLSNMPYSVNDRIVVDNIHPSPYGSMMLAQGWARSILGHMVRPDTTKSEAFETMPSAWLSSGFGLISMPRIRGRELAGILSLHASVFNDGAVAGTFPPSIRVPVTKMLPVTAVSAGGLPVGACSMYIGPDRKFYFFNLPVGTTMVSLDGVTI